MSFFYVYQTALVQTLLSNSPRIIMDQERHGNVRIVTNASITKMFAIMKLSVLMAATKWNAVSILDIVKSILQFYCSIHLALAHSVSLFSQTVWYGRQELSEPPEEQCHCYQCDKDYFCFDITDTDDCPRDATCGMNKVILYF